MKKTLTATEVARNFSDILDLVEGGSEIEITRGKKVIAHLLPQTPESNAASVLRAVSNWQKKYSQMDDELSLDYEHILKRRDAADNKNRELLN